MWQFALEPVPALGGSGPGVGKAPVEEVPYSLDLSDPCAELTRCTSFLLVCLEAMPEAHPGSLQQGPLRVPSRVCGCQETETEF